MILRLMFLGLFVAPVTLVLAPFQILIVVLGLPYAHGLPKLFFTLLAFGLGLKVNLVGAPVKSGAVLLVANHISWLDIPAIGSKLPVSFVAKSEVATYPLVGWLARLHRTIFVDRSRRTDTARTTNAMGAHMSKGNTVLLFAEGTSDIGTHVLPFRSALLGAARNAMGSGVEVVIQPVAIAYTAISNLPLSRGERVKIAWIGDMGVGDNLKAILASGPKTVTIALGAPIPAIGDRKQLALEAETKVREMLVALNRSLPLPSDEILV